MLTLIKAIIYLKGKFYHKCIGTSIHYEQHVKDNAHFITKFFLNFYISYLLAF